ncbi:hypothetical protein [Arsukibacterium indicum]|uniref:Uncharacterized protein n=1 Tax=Arsukibacterium indicum TaxID=2848612 RepID=A0ABS6MQE7_9GAMM|nr:hypothetical protein [Arsukibacterium indicum]MBV2130571.1 hypothetical protein [Arsukibacterium indicum]
MFLYLFLVGPLLLTSWFWYYEEYRYSAKPLSFYQLAGLFFFISYLACCLVAGQQGMLELFSDHHYKMGRALSITGLWTFIIPGIIWPLLIFPRELQLYLFNLPTAGPYTAALGYFLAFFTLLRNLLIL